MSQSFEVLVWHDTEKTSGAFALCNWNRETTTWQKGHFEVMWDWVTNHTARVAPFSIDGVAMCSSVVQCVAVCWSVTNHTARTSPFSIPRVVWCWNVLSVLKCVAVRRSVLQCITVCRSALQCESHGTHLSILYRWCCNVFKCGAVRCSVLQYNTHLSILYS